MELFGTALSTKSLRKMCVVVFFSKHRDRLSLRFPFVQSNQFKLVDVSALLAESRHGTESKRSPASSSSVDSKDNFAASAVSTNPTHRFRCWQHSCLRLAGVASGGASHPFSRSPFQQFSRITISLDDVSQCHLIVCQAYIFFFHRQHLSFLFVIESFQSRAVVL